MKTSMKIAKIVGPTLILMSLTEYLNLSIWENPIPAVTYLNGLLLFIAGLAMVNAHNIWKGWPATLTVIAWLLLLLGLYRVFFPRAPQANEGWLPLAVFVVMAVVGLFLSNKAYFSANDK